MNGQEQDRFKQITEIKINCNKKQDKPLALPKMEQNYGELALEAPFCDKLPKGINVNFKLYSLTINEITIAKFTLKPSKSNSVKLSTLKFALTGLGLADVADADDRVTVTVDGTDVDIDMDKTTTLSEVFYDGTDVDDITDEVEVEVKVTGLEPSADFATPVTLKLLSVNGVSKNSEYSRLIFL